MNYYERAELNASSLKYLLKSPAHFKAYFIDKTLISETTPALRWGTIVHHALLEPETFWNKYAIFKSNIDKRTKEGKELFNKIKKEFANKEFINETEADILEKMYNSLYNKNSWQKILSLNPKFEHEIYWENDYGIACKLKADIIIEPCAQLPNGAIFDLKTCNDAKNFNKEINNYDYYIQVGWYLDGFKKTYGTNPLFGFIPIEKNGIYDCRFLIASERIRNKGIIKCNELLQIYLKCMETNNWYGFEDEFIEEDLPIWDKNNYEI